MGFVREIAIETTEREQLVDITDKVQNLVTELNIKDGFVCVYVPHTSAERGKLAQSLPISPRTYQGR
jgi:thiamine phosphate synthase YjbQ (UPF0047 family)